MAKLFNTFSKRWNQYKYRFVPWIAFNLRKRKVRTVESGSNDKIIPDSKVEQTLFTFFTGLSKKNSDDQVALRGQSLRSQQVQIKNGEQCVRSVHIETIEQCRNLQRKCVPNQYSQHIQTSGKKGCRYGGQAAQVPTKQSCITSTIRQSFGGWNTALTGKVSCNAGCKYLQLLTKRINHFLKVFSMNSYLWLERRGCTPVNLEEREENRLMIKDFSMPREFEEYHKQYYEGSNLGPNQDTGLLSETISRRNFTTAVVSKTHTNHDQTREGSSLSCDGLEVMRRILGFTVERRPSSITGGGTGVCVTSGIVPAKVVLAMYPGTVYKPWEPILLQSLANPFIFRCLDGTLIDGNDKGLSRMIYRSCTQRDRMGPYMTSDLAWLTNSPINPLAVGQYINNQNTDNAANVTYQEFNIPESFPFHLLRYVPNAFYSSTYQQDDSAKQRLMRCVVLVSLREIQCGEELFSSYFTIVH